MYFLESNKLLTTFSEKSSAQDNNGRLRSPRELRKFAKLDVLDAVSGEHHLLVHGIQPAAPILSSSSNEFDEDHLNDNNNQRAFNQTYTKPVDQTTLTEKLKQCLAGTAAPKEIVSKIPIADVRRKSNSSSGDDKATSRKSSQNSLDNGSAKYNEQAAAQNSQIKEETDALPPAAPSTPPAAPAEVMEKSLSLNEFEILEQAAAAEILEFETAGIEIIQEAVNEDFMDTVESTTPLPIVQSPESQKSTSAQTEFYFSPEPKDEIAENSPQKEMLAQQADSADLSPPNTAEKSLPISGDVKFIDNGIEVTTFIENDPIDVEPVEKPSVDETAESIELTAEQMVDRLLGEDLNATNVDVTPRDMIEGNFCHLYKYKKKLQLFVL